ncbi:hypothetical protein B0A50_02824 [Salinomyces thailandicus]|uniref:Uncharacterized protein n=1 Tax=Salinomyces thailandicus TaxID=706561 RepID=A0A4U0U7B1_9PEZI|nr:hypothetical protein B0A50_02824 [Salinomyces thailandica]
MNSKLFDPDEVDLPSYTEVLERTSMASLSKCSPSEGAFTEANGRFKRVLGSFNSATHRTIANDNDNDNDTAAAAANDNRDSANPETSPTTANIKPQPNQHSSSLPSTPTPTNAATSSNPLINHLVQTTQTLLSRLLTPQTLECAYCATRLPLRENFPRTWHIPRQCHKHLVPPLHTLKNLTGTCAVTDATAEAASQADSASTAQGSYPCRACLAKALAAQVQLRETSCSGRGTGGRESGGPGSSGRGRGGGGAGGGLWKIGCPVCRAVWGESTLLRNMETRGFRRLRDLRAAAGIIGERVG